MQVGADTHSVLLENARVRVLAAHVAPGGKVPMHSHPANVIYFFGDATLRITLPDGSIRIATIKAAYGDVERTARRTRSKTSARPNSAKCRSN